MITIFSSSILIEPRRICAAATDPEKSAQVSRRFFSTELKKLL